MKGILCQRRKVERNQDLRNAKVLRRRKAVQRKRNANMLTVTGERFPVENRRLMFGLTTESNGGI